MTPGQRAKRNLKPHAEAKAAMWLFGADYSRYGGGSMDFWDGLPPSKQRMCRDMVNEIFADEKANGRAAIRKAQPTGGTE